MEEPSGLEINSLIESYQKGRYEDAINLAIPMTQNFPKYQLAWKILGVSFRRLDRLNDAIIANKEALKISPQDFEVHNNLANIFIDLSKLDQAEESLSKALLLKPDFVEAHFSLGNIFLELARFAEAEASFKKLIALKASYPEAHHHLAMTLKAQEKLGESELSFSKAIALKPDFAEALGNFGLMLQEQGRLEEAEVRLREAIALKPDFAEAHCNLGITLKDLGKLEEAEVSLRQAIALKVNLGEAHKNLAEILRNLNRPDQANESDRGAVFLNASSSIKTEPKITFDNLAFKSPSPIEYPEHYRPGMGTENVGGFLRSMVHMLRPEKILEIGAGYTTPFLLEALVNNERVYGDGNLKESYFKNYIYDPKLVLIDNMSLGELSQKSEMNDIISSEYVEFIKGNFEGRASSLLKKYGNFDFVWFDCGGATEYKKFIDEYWDICSGYIFFHFTYFDGSPNENHKLILNNIKGNPKIFDIVEPHKHRQGSITMVQK